MSNRLVFVHGAWLTPEEVAERALNRRPPEPPADPAPAERRGRTGPAPAPAAPAEKARTSA
jgi:hypothetical protein